MLIVAESALQSHQVRNQLRFFGGCQTGILQAVVVIYDSLQGLEPPIMIEAAFHVRKEPS